MNLFVPQKIQGEEPEFGRAARGMTRAYAEGLRKHKQAVFEDFQALIPKLDKAFPDYTFIVRPHPTENQQVYQQIATQCDNVHVNNEGNVVPWLMGARALIHNGCTTGVEAYLMEIPAISYRATISPDYDDGFFHLPNSLSYQCFNFDELQTMLNEILSGSLSVLDNDACKTVINQHLAAQNGPLSCERITDVCEKMLEEGEGFDKPNIIDMLLGRYKAIQRGRRKKAKSNRGKTHLKPDFQQHRYPDISVDKIRKRIVQLQAILGAKREIKAERLFSRLIRISQI
jgi:hypothetical protein